MQFAGFSLAAGAADLKAYIPTATFADAGVFTDAGDGSVSPGTGDGSISVIGVDGSVAGLDASGGGANPNPGHGIPTQQKGCASAGLQAAPALALLAALAFWRRRR